MSKTRLSAQYAMKRVEQDRKKAPTVNKTKSVLPPELAAIVPLSKSGEMKKCRDCVHSNPDCTFCNLRKKAILPYGYGCFDHMTDEEEKKKRTEAAAVQAAQVSIAWQKMQKTEEEKCNWLLTLMLDMIVGSQILLSDFERRTDWILKNNPFPDAEDVANHKSDKDWIFKHKYAFGAIHKTYESMKKKFEEGCSKIRTTFENTIQKHIVGMCTDKAANEFDEQKYTSIDFNAAEITRLMMLVMNKVVGHNGNFEKIVDFVAQLDGVDVFKPEDIAKFKTK